MKNSARLTCFIIITILFGIVHAAPQTIRETATLKIPTKSTLLTYQTELPIVLRDWCSPTIVFTYVPPYGSFDDLRGYISCLVPDNYKAAVYIFFAEFNRWFIRPCCDDPLTVIQPDGSWIADITSFEYDQYANSIAVFLIPNGYNPPFEDLSAELYKNAVTFAFVDR